ncbi:TPA: ATP-binding cassette domain-containing protein, partial [Providencia rettgeri]|nr:ATP-binding cassette domain-containing protein [Providencia rettgeri]
YENISFDKISLEIYSNEFIVITGSSEYERIKLLNIISGIDSHYIGHVYLMGSYLSSLNELECSILRNKFISLIYKHPCLLSTLTIYENVSYPLLLKGMNERNAKNHILKIMEYIGINQFADKLPKELPPLLLYKAAIARALITNPKLIIAYEPIVYLDANHSEQLVELLINIKQELGTSVIISTHNDAITSKVNRVLELENGKLKNVKFTN